MLIPKDATIVIPSFALNNSERYNYKDPDEFRPSRYINHPRLANDYAGSPDFNNRGKHVPIVASKVGVCLQSIADTYRLSDHYSYGGGRRICVGIHLAERAQWRAIAKLLWAFDIEMPANAKNEPQPYNEGIIHTPSPYEVNFKPRSQAHIDIINRDFAEQAHILHQFE